MDLQHLRVYDFRNFSELETNFSKGINVFCGENAQGKTNLLEAIFFLISLKPARAFKEQELIRYGKSRAFVKGLFGTKTGPVERQITLYENRKKVVKENEVAKARWQDLSTDIDGVYFSPEDLNLVKGEPSGRRKFLDMAIYQTRPGFFKYLQGYHRVLSQRNALLKDIRKAPSLKTTLDSWDEQLSNLGALFIIERLKVLQKIAELGINFYDSFTSGASKLNMIYQSTISYKNTETLKEDFIKSLRINREKDLYRCYTTIGPHRDDVKFLIDDKDARHYASQGQQRLITLCLKFAQRELLFMEKGEYPILLLDDVMSELDTQKRRLILEREDHQVFITTTDLRLIPQEILDKSSIYTIKSGVLG